ncbi:ABC transporter ATP-binding protein [Candidatus Galacturonibacter soehngenii]|uniref:ABC transporter ATP-binding protein n=2 Tax=Candidatus Galacturonatibacter soehngenii TaxID=2307010 RepID=A0A7V7QN54_9FIRM|nr:ABC transporter ATP-binding protein [Candidatus Galacturonibacter soehngenii]
MPFIVLTVFFSVIHSWLAVYLARILQKVIDIALIGNMASFQKMLVLSIFYIVLLSFISFLYSLSSKKLVCLVTKGLRQRTFYGIFQRNAKAFHDVNTADYLSATTNDIKLIEENFLNPLLLVLQYLVMFIMTLKLLFEISPTIMLCLIGCIVVMILVPSILGNALQRRQETFSHQNSSFTQKLKDYFLGYEVIKSYQMEEKIKKEFEHENKRFTDTRFHVEQLLSLNEGVSEILAFLTQFSGMFIGAYLIIKGEITAGTLVALIQLSATFVSPVMIILQNIPKISGITPVIKRIDALIEYQEDLFGDKILSSFEDKINMEDVTFSYKENQPVLNGLNLSIHKNKKYAIVGKSGCGKSTLVKLLTGYYSDYQGKISYDDNNLMELKIQELNRMISTIHQSVYMFDESVRENICLYETYTEEELADALDKSGVTQFLGSLTDGISTLVGENGKNLSGGQKQRIAVARALIRKKPILILDEGTSAVDMQNAYDIEKSLLEVNDLTLITITHNMNYDILSLYDEILYMENGKVEEYGQIDELLSKKEKFYQFYHLKK